MSADVEELLVAALAAQFPVARVCTELPATLPAQVIQVVRVAGLDTFSTDGATVDVECYTTDRLSATALAMQVRSWLRLSAAGYTALGATIAAVATVSGPGWRPYDNTNVRRVGATYLVTVHNHQ